MVPLLCYYFSNSSHVTRGIVTNLKEYLSCKNFVFTFLEIRSVLSSSSNTQVFVATVKLGTIGVVGSSSANSMTFTVTSGAVCISNVTARMLNLEVEYVQNIFASSYSGGMVGPLSGPL